MPAVDRACRRRAQPHGHWLLACLTLLAATAAACLSATRPSVKIGLVAPFEGRYRDVGYEVIYAVRLAVREANASGGAGGYSIELVALDDGGQADSALAQARKLATDPRMLGVIGHWLDATTQAAASAYAEVGLPLLATSASPLPPGTFRLWPDTGALQAALPAEASRSCLSDCPSLEDMPAWFASQHLPPGTRLYGPPLWAQGQFLSLAGANAEGVYVVAPAPLPVDSTDSGFAERYRATSNGVEPRANAVLAYDATRLLLAAIAEAARTQGTLTPAGVADVLRTVSLEGLSGPISFDANGNWVEARGWVYQWRGNSLVAAGP